MLHNQNLKRISQQQPRITNCQLQQVLMSNKNQIQDYVNKNSREMKNNKRNQLPSKKDWLNLIQKNTQKWTKRPCYDISLPPPKPIRQNTVMSVLIHSLKRRFPMIPLSKSKIYLIGPKEHLKALNPSMSFKLKYIQKHLKHRIISQSVLLQVQVKQILLYLQSQRRLENIQMQKIQFKTMILRLSTFLQ